MGDGSWCGRGCHPAAHAPSARLFFPASAAARRAALPTMTAAACLPIISQCGFVHSFARQHCADPSTEGLADQQRRRKISEEDSRRDEQERAKNHEFWAWKARNLSAWAPRGMG